MVSRVRSVCRRDGPMRSCSANDRSPRIRTCGWHGISESRRGECRGHRPADNATAEGIEHDREVEKARPCRNVGDAGDPQPIRRLRREVALNQVRRLAATILDRGGDEPAPTHTGKTGPRHAPAARRRCRAKLCAQHGSPRSAPRRSRHQRRTPLHPRMIAAGGDTQHSAHRGDWIIGLVIAREPEPFGGIAFVSRANQAAAPGSSPGQAFERISHSSRSWRFSRRSRLSSSRSAVVRPPSPRPALRSHCATQFLIDCAVGSNSCASSSGVRPACTNSIIWRRNSGG